MDLRRAQILSEMCGRTRAFAPPSSFDYAVSGATFSRRVVQDLGRSGGEWVSWQWDITWKRVAALACDRAESNVAAEIALR